MFYCLNNNILLVNLRLSELVTIPDLKISQIIAFLSSERQVTDDSPTPQDWKTKSIDREKGLKNLPINLS